MNEYESQVQHQQALKTVYITYQQITNHLQTPKMPLVVCAECDSTTQLESHKISYQKINLKHDSNQRRQRCQRNRTHHEAFAELIPGGALLGGFQARVPCVAGAPAWSASITSLPSTSSSSSCPPTQLSQSEKKAQRSPWSPSRFPTRFLPPPKTPRTLGKRCKVLISTCNHWTLQIARACFEDWDASVHFLIKNRAQDMGNDLVNWGQDGARTRRR